MNAVGQPGSHSTVWWKEPELLGLLLIVFVAQFVRIADLDLRGEESRRATVAMEMLRTGDWLVPRQQGQAYFSRPPLQNWLIAIAAQIRGQCDITAVRLPSAIATLLITLLIYGYARGFLSRLGAFASAAAFTTATQVVHLGGSAETEAVFTLFVGSSLLVWHWGYSRGWGDAKMWVFSYALVALGTLTKGPQAPVYFAASVGVFLLINKDWKRLFSLGHLFGIVTFVVLFGAWALPYTARMGMAATENILFNNAAGRFFVPNAEDVFGHLIGFPLEWMACLAPWSILLLLYLCKPFCDSIGEERQHVRFLLVCLLVTFPTCWLAMGARVRYLMPMYPCVAPLFGLAIQRCVEAPAGSVLHRYWTRFVIGCVALFSIVPILAATGRELQTLTGWQLAQPLLLSAGLTITLVAMLMLLFRYRSAFDAIRSKLAVFLLAMIIAVSYSGWYLQLLLERSVDTKGAVAVLKEQLRDEKMVSFGRLHHLFTYHYGDLIPVKKWPAGDGELPQDVNYFCFDPLYESPPASLRWKQIAIINCDRNPRNPATLTVVVGQRLRENDVD